MTDFSFTLTHTDGMGRRGVISTSRGVLTSRQAEQARVGGELLCEVW